MNNKDALLPRMKEPSLGMVALAVCLAGLGAGLSAAFVLEQVGYDRKLALYAGYLTFVICELVSFGLGFISRQERAGKIAAVMAGTLTAVSLALMS